VIISEYLSNEDRAIQAKALAALGEIPSTEAKNILLERLQTESHTLLTREIAEALGNFDYPEVLETLKTTVETHKDTFTRQGAGKSLIALGQISIVQKIMNTHEDKMFQRSAAEALAASDHGAVAEIMHQALSHPYSGVQVVAIEKLAIRLLKPLRICS